MKYRLFFLCVFTLLALSSCKNEQITITITSPADGAIFSRNQSVPVNVKASTTKGSIIQVQIFIDDSEPFASRTATPYNFIIPPDTMSAGLHIISATAYSSGKNQEMAAIMIKIEE